MPKENIRVFAGERYLYSITLKAARVRRKSGELEWIRPGIVSVISNRKKDLRPYSLSASAGPELIQRYCQQDPQAIAAIDGLGGWGTPSIKAVTPQKDWAPQIAQVG